MVFIVNSKEICFSYFNFDFALGWSQTTLTFPSELPSHVMEILKPYLTFIQVNAKLSLFNLFERYNLVSNLPLFCF